MSRTRFKPLVLAAVLLGGWLGAPAGSALAWKPKTHIYLADRALRQIVDGRIAIHRVNAEDGTVLGKVGDYAVDTALVNAIRTHRGIFNAGVLGPDVYPDIVTGQMLIHPEVAHDEGSNTWLEHLWSKAKTAGPKEKAFVAGFLFHAAGDMYAHTYMNHFSGGDFAAGANALRHLTLEGYIGTKTPPVAAREFSIRATVTDHAVRDFIYQHMIRASLGSTLENRLLIAGAGAGSQASVPRVYSWIRNQLAQQVVELGTGHVHADPLAPLKRAYLNAWIADIDRGLKEWPYFSESLGRLLVYNLDETMTQAEMKERITKLCNGYVNEHLLSMSGAPDFVGLTRGQVQALVDPFAAHLRRFKDDLTNTLVRTVTGYTLDEITDYLKRPAVRFDATLGPAAIRDATSAGAASITRSEFDARHLEREANGEWKLESFPSAYNTVLMTQLVLLEKSEVDRLISDLRLLRLPALEGGDLRTPSLAPSVTAALAAGLRTGMTADNAMLGFIRKLDGSNQWRRNGPSQQMALVRAGVYERIFMNELGENDEVVTPPAPLPAGTVRVTITRVRNVDDVDPGPGQGAADFYGWIEIGERFRSFATVENSNLHAPNWSLSKEVVGNSVPIRIRLFDEDTGLAAPDDPCDIDPHPGDRTLALAYDLRTGRITGDASGDRGVVITVRGAGDSDRCEISFRVDGP